MPNTRGVYLPNHFGASTPCGEPRDPKQPGKVTCNRSMFHAGKHRNGKVIWKGAK